MSGKRTLYLGTNTKMFKTAAQTEDYLKELQSLTKDLDREALELFVIPSFTAIKPAAECAAANRIRIGAQNICWEEEGAFSGEISVNPDLTEVADKNLAQDSITYLNLNSESLIAMRKIAMLETVKMLEKGIAPADILRELSGKLPPFYSAAKTAAQIFNSSRNTVGNTANS